ncbi:MAG: hypothetical protein IJT32_07475, partial [Lachnospiraceae bacterium]|nr:hypothetical protein [Lachnospiraceae bacterium]
QGLKPQSDMGALQDDLIRTVVEEYGYTKSIETVDTDTAARSSERKLAEEMLIEEIESNEDWTG